MSNLNQKIIDLREEYATIDRKDNEFHWVKNRLLKDHHGIRCNYDKQTRLVIFYRNKSHDQSINNADILMDCNGVIYDYSDWSLVCCPPSVKNIHIQPKVVSKNFPSYKIRKLRAGTTVNAYYHNDDWRLSTYRGFDVTNLPIRGKTYKSAIDDAKFNLEDLDKKQSHSLLLVDKDIHFAPESECGVFPIVSCDLETITYNELDTTEAFEQIDESKFETYDDFYQWYLTDVTNAIGCAGIHLYDPEKEHKFYNDVFIESTWMRAMRNSVTGDIKVPDEYSRYNWEYSNYIVLKNWITMNRETLHLFPQLPYMEWETIFLSNKKKIYEYLTGKTLTDGPILQHYMNNVKTVALLLKDMQYLPAWYNIIFTNILHLDFPVDFVLTYPDMTTLSDLTSQLEI